MPHGDLPALDFDRSVAAIVPALLGLHDADWLPEPVRGRHATVLLVIDGLGWQAFADAPEALPTLSSFAGGPIDTVLPATTATALTSITTGTTPGTHGIFGYRMRVDEHVLNNLRWQCEPRSAPAPDPEWVQRQRPFRGHIVPVVATAEHAESGFSRAHLRDVPFVGWQEPDDIVTACRSLILDGHRLVYAYYPGVDEVAHEFGLLGAQYRDELAAADSLVARLRAALPDSCALLVTADHGQVHLESESWIVHEPALANLVAMQAGDARCRFLYARAGAAGELAAACREAYGAVAWVCTRRELLDAATFGPVATGSIAGRLGDVVLLPRTAFGFVDPALPRERSLRSAHGSATPAELRVPLLGA